MNSGRETSETEQKAHKLTQTCMVNIPIHTDIIQKSAHTLSYTKINVDPKTINMLEETGNSLMTFVGLNNDFGDCITSKERQQKQNKKMILY